MSIKNSYLDEPIFYLCKDGDIFTLDNIINAFHIVTGKDPIVHEEYENEFYEFLNNLLKTTLTCKLDNPSVEFLSKNKSMIYAIKKYRWEHNCTLVEAKHACEEIREKLKNTTN